MPADALSQLQAAVTKTAAFDGASVDLKVGTPHRGLVVRIRYSAANTSAGAGAATFQVEESDNGSTWRDLVTFDPLTLGTAAIAGMLVETVVTRSRYIRVVLSAISGTDATVTYEAEVMAGRP